MKKLAFLLVFTFVISTVIFTPVRAMATPRVAVTTPSLTFSGITATCIANVVADDASDHIEVNMKLMWSDTCVASWTAHGDCFVTITKTVPVTYGRTYTLVVNTWINGIQQTTQSVTNTC